jgi:hypothetical protein
MNMMRLGGMVTLIAIVALLLVLRRRGAAQLPLSGGGAA